MANELLIKNIIKKNIVDQEATIRGWVRSVRKKKSFSFIVINDGSNVNGLQIVADAGIDGYEEASIMLAGTSVSITGKLVKSMGKGQTVEMHANGIKIIGSCDETYPLQKKKTSLEFLREKAHLRSRTNTFGAVMRVRHALSFATHEFFNNRDFYYLHTPIITGSDCEGAGEMFKVTTLDLLNVPKDDKGAVDFSNDYFGMSTNLTVSGQLEAETYAMGLGKVYTFGPTFRAENSNTPRHISEFWMIEPEVAFYDLDDVTTLAEEYLKYLISYVLEKNIEDIEFLQSTYQNDLVSVLEKVRSSDFVRISYTEALDILQKAQNDGHKFDFNVSWGSDIQTEHERYLAEKHFEGPVVVTDYPKEIKPFYMKQNEDGKTVRAMDILVPGIGEIMGGSQRECDYNLLKNRILEMGQNLDDYWWYLELRKYGSVPHSGFGLGFERVIMYITGMSNIRDTIAFPRSPKNAGF